MTDLNRARRAAESAAASAAESIARAEQKFLELMVHESDEDEMLDDVLTKVCADAIGSQIAALLCFDRERGLDGRERGLLGRLLEAKRDIAHGAFSARLARGL